MVKIQMLPADPPPAPDAYAGRGIRWQLRRRADIWGAFQERPAISPDGSTIAYPEFADSFVLSHGLFVANSDRSYPHELTPAGQPGVESADTTSLRA
jgi:hypothetical protein